MTRQPVLVLLVLLFALVGNDRVSQARSRDIAGPLVGHVTANDATIWFYDSQRANARVFYRREGEPKSAARSSPVSRESAGPRMARATLSELQPDTRYLYSVFLQGRTQWNWKGAFRTAPKVGSQARFTMAVSSCMRHDRPQASWGVLFQQEPAFQLLLGDNVYADTTRRGRLWAAHLKMRAVSEFATTIRYVPTYAVWDDHDYGRDNSDGTLPGKAESLRTFKELWANPAAGTPNVPGTFFDFSWGDVDFFVMDGRYHRSPNRARNDHRKKMLGDGQFRWLIDRLAQSKATFKVLGSGTTLKDDPKDNWGQYAFARNRLYQAIAKRKIPGVLFLSGDLHRSLVRVHPKSETGFYDLVEVISSGIAQKGEGSFAAVTFDTTVDDPTVSVRVFIRTGALKEERTFALSQMTFAEPK